MENSKEGPKNRKLSGEDNTNSEIYKYARDTFHERLFFFNKWVEAKCLFYCMNPILSTVTIIYTDLKTTFLCTLDMWIAFF
jgi:hypothetical protein